MTMRALFTRLGRLVEARPGSILAATVLLVVLAVLGVTQTRIVTTQDVFVDKNSDTAKNSVAYASAFGGDPLVVMIAGTPQELTSPATLGKIKTLTDQMTKDRDVRSTVSVLTLLSAAPLPSGVSLDQPGVATGIVFDAEGKPNSAFASLFPTGHELLQVTLKDGVSVDEQNKVSGRVQDAVKAAGLPDGTVVGGYPRLYSDITSSITHDMGVTAVVAVLLMVLVLYIVFPVRRRLMALPVVVLGVLLTFGITGAAGVSLTLVTMAGLPILLGLGMDFAIQFHNRYEEELARGDTPAAGLIDALTHIGPAVGTAVLATILGFITLSLSAVPAVRDFGLLLALGVAILYCVALVALNALLYRFDKAPSLAVREEETDLPAVTADSAERRRPRLDLSRYLVRVSSLSVRFGLPVLTLAAVLAVGGLAVDHLVPVQTDIEKLVPADSPGVVAMNEIRDATGSSSYIQFLVTADDVTSPEVLDWTAGFEMREMQRHSQIVGFTSLPTLLGIQPASPAPDAQVVAGTLSRIPAAIRSSIVTDDHKATSLTFDVTEMSTADVATLIGSIGTDANAPTGVSVVPAGATNMAASIFQSLTQGRLQIALAGFLAVFVGLLLVHRSWRRAIVPVAPIVLVTCWSSGAMWLLGIELNPLTAVMSALIVGIGTEFSVLLLERYWEELGRGADRLQAMNRAVSRIGRAIAASGLTVVAGFAALLASSFPVIREFGAVTVIDVLLALVATIVVVPPLALFLIPRGEERQRAVMDKA
jgi:hydrophobe/amphiphile efflux-3 (HAE3) family protein